MGDMIKKGAKSIALKIFMALIPILVPAILIFIVLIAFFASFMEVENEVSAYEGSSFSSISDYGDTTQEKIWFALTDYFSEEQVAGVMGNMFAESSFDPSAVNPSSGASGLCQWLGGRKDGLIKYANSKNKNWTDLDIQLEFLLAEVGVKGTGAEDYAVYQLGMDDSWLSSKTVDGAARDFYNGFERGGPEQWSENRVTTAQEYYNQFHGKTKPKTSGSGQEKASTTPGIRGYFTSSTGRQYIEYCQNHTNSNWYWDAGCFDCTIATIVSGFGGSVTPNKLSGYNTGMGQRAELTKYGNCNIQTYTSGINAADIRKFLKNGDAIMFHSMCLTTDNGTYSWSAGHWMALLDYKKENGVEKVFVCDPWDGEICHGWSNINIVVNGIDEYIRVYK